METGMSQTMMLFFVPLLQVISLGLGQPVRMASPGRLDSSATADA